MAMHASRFTGIHLPGDVVYTPWGWDVVESILIDSDGTYVEFTSGRGCLVDGEDDAL